MEKVRLKGIDIKMTYYSILKAAYRSLPESVKSLTTKGQALYPFFQPIKSFLHRHAKHDEVYDQTYYLESVERPMVRSAPIIAQYIKKQFDPKSVVDVGCGTGQLLLELQNLGVNGIGLEYSSAAIKIATEKGLNVSHINLENNLDKLGVYKSELVVSTEVAEHLPAQFADTYVSFLCRTADRVLMTAAPPGQGGTDHVNEQPNSYWVQKFASRGFVYEEAISKAWREAWERLGVEYFYYSNLMIFKKSSVE